jgi:hypothetical protein
MAFDGTTGAFESLRTANDELRDCGVDCKGNVPEIFVVTQG